VFIFLEPSHSLLPLPPDVNTEETRCGMYGRQSFTWGDVMVVMAAKFRMVLTPGIAEEIARGKRAERNLEKKNTAGRQYDGCFLISVHNLQKP
jgi:hypothetical protein